MKKVNLYLLNLRYTANNMVLLSNILLNIFVKKIVLLKKDKKNLS